MGTIIRYRCYLCLDRVMGMTADWSDDCGLRRWMRCGCALCKHWRHRLNLSLPCLHHDRIQTPTFCMAFFSRILPSKMRFNNVMLLDHPPPSPWLLKLSGLDGTNFIAHKCAWKCFYFWTACIDLFTARVSLLQTSCDGLKCACSLLPAFITWHQVDPGSFSSWCNLLLLLLLLTGGI